MKGLVPASWVENNKLYMIPSLDLLIWAHTWLKDQLQHTYVSTFVWFVCLVWCTQSTLDLLWVCSSLHGAALGEKQNITYAEELFLCAQRPFLCTLTDMWNTCRVSSPHQSGNKAMWFLCSASKFGGTREIPFQAGVLHANLTKRWVKDKSLFFFLFEGKMNQSEPTVMLLMETMCLVRLKAVSVVRKKDMIIQK